MKRFSITLGVFLAALLSQICVAQPAQKKSITKEPPGKYGPQKLKEITPALVEQLSQYARLRRLLFTDPMDCTYDADGSCPILIQLIQVSDGTGTYCVGLLPSEVHLASTAPGNTEKRLVWALIPPSSTVPNAKFYFYGEKDHGITVLSDVKAQMHNGFLGDGKPGTPDPMKFNVKNKHKAIATAVYVPIVLKEDTVTHEISLCGTPDPRILND